MNPGRFFMPNMPYMSMGGGYGIPTAMGNAVRMSSAIPGRMGLFSRIGSGIRSFNWSGLLSGANKTLNVMNQTIPLIKQAKPMVNNMKSMLRLAKAFGNETVTKTASRNNNSNTNNNHSKINSNNKVSNDADNENYNTSNHSDNNSNSPTFFL